MLLNIIFDDAAEEDGSVTANYQVGHLVMQIKQKPGEGHAIVPGSESGTQQQEADSTSTSTSSAPAPSTSHEAYPNVGLMVWQSAFNLAEYLLRHPPDSSWEGVRVVELGCGVGIVGIALGAAGAKVAMTDLAHITPLAQENVDSNSALCRGNVEVLPFPWGEDPASVGLAPPEVLVAADVLYEPQHYEKLLDSLVRLTAEATEVYVAYRHRGSYREEVFEPMARGAGFRVERVPEAAFSAEFQGRGFHLLHMRRCLAPAPKSS